ALVNEAEMQDARLIVVGNRRMQGLGRVLGSVANTVAHTAPCDVYIAKTDQP
ncbi:universal stress protein, partial [Paenarthrobacter nicotinovorans]|uniref:universal stress protein n=1 Tax=Paenarthrobacter nicotinovorans TaxID=29320 RepID=UPI0024860545